MNETPESSPGGARPTPSRPTHSEVIESTATTEATMRPQTTPLNVYESAGALVVVAPMPAVSPEDVTVELRGDRLRIWSHVRSAPPRHYLLHEWEYGGYERELTLPEGYGSGVEAVLANGQLVVRVLAGEPLDSTINPRG